MVILYQAITRSWSRLLAVGVVSSILWMIFIIDYEQISEYWQGRLNSGGSAYIQESLFNQTKTILEKKGFQLTKSTLIYFDVSQDLKKAETYDRGIISLIYHRIRYLDDKIQESCIFITAEDFNSFQQKIKVINSDQLIYNTTHYRCTSYRARDFIDYSGPFIPEQIYAFRLKDLKVTDITDEVLEKLNYRTISN